MQREKLAATLGLPASIIVVGGNPRCCSCGSPAMPELARAEIVAFTGPLLFGVVCGLWGVRSWRVLQFDVQEMAMTIASHEGAANSR